jgi:hypothetical protein
LRWRGSCNCGQDFAAIPFAGIAVSVCAISSPCTGGLEGVAEGPCHMDGTLHQQNWWRDESFPTLSGINHVMPVPAVLTDESHA